MDPKSGQAGIALALCSLSTLLITATILDMFSLYLLALFLFISIVTANPTFRLAEILRGNDFFDSFIWETFDDPTHGRVNYVDKDTAKANNLSYGNAFSLMR